MTDLRCSVVIPSFGEAASIGQTLGALFDQTLPHERYEVVVVDNNRDEAASAWLAAAVAAFPVRMVRATTPGPAAARNAGIAAVTGDVVVFVDDDVITPREFLEAHLSVHEEGDLAVGVGRIIEHNSHSRWFLRYLTERRVVNRIPDADHLDFRYFYGANASVPRAVLVELGGYDERFIRREDAELGFRLAERGLRFRYVERAAVEHHSSFGPVQHVRRSYWNGYYLAMLLEAHPAVGDQQDLSLYRPWKRVAAALAAPPLVVLGALVYPLTTWPLFTGITALVLTQNGRGFAAFRRR